MQRSCIFPLSSTINDQNLLRGVRKILLRNTDQLHKSLKESPISYHQKEKEFT